MGRPDPAAAHLHALGAASGQLAFSAPAADWLRARDMTSNLSSSIRNTPNPHSTKPIVAPLPTRPARHNVSIPHHVCAAPSLASCSVQPPATPPHRIHLPRATRQQPAKLPHRPQPARPSISQQLCAVRAPSHLACTTKTRAAFWQGDTSPWARHNAASCGVRRPGRHRLRAGLLRGDPQRGDAHRRVLRAFRGPAYARAEPLPGGLPARGRPARGPRPTKSPEPTLELG